MERQQDDTQKFFKPKNMRHTRTRAGVPALWSNIRVYETMTRHVYVLDYTFKPKSPIFTRRYANQQTLSQLVCLNENDYVLKVFYDDKGEGVSLMQVRSIQAYSNFASTDLIVRRNPGTEEWIVNPALADDAAVRYFLENYDTIRDTAIQTCIGDSSAV